MDIDKVLGGSYEPEQSWEGKSRDEIIDERMKKVSDRIASLEDRVKELEEIKPTPK